MSKCPSCQAETVDGDQFCSRCGVELINAGEQQFQTGRRLVILSGLILLGLYLFNGAIELILASWVGTQVLDCQSTLISASLEAAIFYMVYQGHTWARWLSALLSLARVILVLLFINQFTASQGAVFMLVVTALGLGANTIILLFSSSVRAFQQSQRARARLAT